MKPKILYVDDERINLMNFKISFSREWDVYTAFDGESALQLLQDQNFDLILTDHKMPRMTGVELIRSLRRTNNIVPCVVVTGFLDNEEVEAALSSRLVQQVLTKPYSRGHLEQVVRSLLDSASTRQG